MLDTCSRRCDLSGLGAPRHMDILKLPLPSSPLHCAQWHIKALKCLSLKKNFGVYLIYSVVLASAGWQSDSAMHIVYLFSL